MDEKKIIQMLIQLDARLSTIAEKVERIDSTMVTKEEFKTLSDNTVTREEFQGLVDTVESMEKTTVTRGEFHSMADRIKTIEKTMATRDELYTMFDKVMVILVQLQQERIFSSKWVNRIEGDLNRIKNHLQLS